MQTEKQLTIKDFFSRESVKQKFEELLGQRSVAYIKSLQSVVNSNGMLSQADPNTIYQAAMVAATLNLPIDQNLGLAYIIPYNVKQKDGTYMKAAQFQIGYKGFIQLAMRSGQFKTISSAPVHEGQIVTADPLQGYEFDWTVKSDVVIGYAAYFKLINGFEKTLYMTVDELKRHGSKYSKTFSNQYGLWNTDFNAMANKTVLKLLLSKFAPLSVDMQTAEVTDQAIINDADTLDVSYVDNEPEPEIDHEMERVRLLIEDAQDAKELKKYKKIADEQGLSLMYNHKLKQIENV